MAGNDVKRVGLYIRLGSKGYGFILPDDRKRLKAFMDSESKTDKANEREKYENFPTLNPPRYLTQ
jgi:hypothetical protein